MHVHRTEFFQGCPRATARQWDSEEPSTTIVRNVRAVYFRLERVFVVVDDVAEEFRWNKRSGVWRADDGEAVELEWLFASPGPLVQASVRPNGCGFSVHLAWDAGNECFSGQTIEGNCLDVLKEDMLAMLYDPWAGQFQGYSSYY